LEVLEKRWQQMEEALGHWNVAEIVYHRAAVRNEVLKILNSPRKVDAVLDIAAWLHEEGWDVVHSEILKRTAHDERGNIVVTPELLSWLDELPYVGTIMAAFVAKNLGISSIKDDVWMRRLAKWLGYTADANGVWAMAMRIQEITGEKLNVIDTVLWNWARKQNWLAEGSDFKGQKKKHSVMPEFVCIAGGHTIIAAADDTAAWEEDEMNAEPGKECWFCGRTRTEAERQHPHGLCHDCYHLRRMVRRALRSGDRPVPKGREEMRIRERLCGG